MDLLLVQRGVTKHRNVQNRSTEKWKTQQNQQNHQHPKPIGWATQKYDMFTPVSLNFGPSPPEVSSEPGRRGSSPNESSTKISNGNVGRRATVPIVETKKPPPYSPSQTNSNEQVNNCAPIKRKTSTGKKVKNGLWSLAAWIF